MKILAALVAGIVFGLGLAISGMVDPARVLGFLDLDGDWDPTLAFVLGGAVAVSACGYALSRRMDRPLLADRFQIPATTRIDARLLGGSALFGIGWGLTGFCPGPALASLFLGLVKSAVFVLAMLGRMLLHDRARRGAASDRPVANAG